MARNAIAVFKALMPTYPEGNMQQNNRNNLLPLHVAIDQQTGAHAAAVVTLLLSSHRDGVRHTDKKGWLPLHYAARSQEGEQGAAIVTLLLTAYHAGAMQKANNGHLPLHYWGALCQGGEHAVAILRLLLEAYREGARQKSMNGDLPGTVRLVANKASLALQVSRFCSMRIPRVSMSRTVKDTCRLKVLR